MSTWQERNAAALALLYPVLRDRLTAALYDLESAGIPTLIVQGLRTWLAQQAIWDRGRTTPGEPCTHNHSARPLGTCPEHPLGATVSNAKPGWSAHNFGLAADLAPDNLEVAGLQPDWNAGHPAWPQMLAIAARHGLAEGAQWRSYPDLPHVYPRELHRDGHGDTPTDLMRARFAAGGLPAVWAEVDGIFRPQASAAPA